MTANASWKDSILLPKTDFAMKADLAKREPELQKRWETDWLYHRLLEARAAKKKFVLHVCKGSGSIRESGLRRD
jgi:isoleucyl-tRNA synthetase